MGEWLGLCLAPFSAGRLLWETWATPWVKAGMHILHGGRQRKIAETQCQTVAIIDLHGFSFAVFFPLYY